MNIKERLLGISALKLAGDFMQVDDIQFNAYMKVLNTYVDSVSALEPCFREAVSGKEYGVLIKHLTSAHTMLAGIHADDLAKECQEYIELLNNPQKPEHQKTEEFTELFYASMLTLSIDIQVINREQKKEDAEKKAAPENTGRKSILAVDDAAFFLQIIQIALKETDYTITCLTSGSAALKYVRANQPDLVILDVNMPEMNGFDLARKIREDGYNAPIIFLTSIGTKEYVIKALQSGGTDFIVKPLNKDQILARIKKHIGE